MRNAFSLQQKETVLVAFWISQLRELKNLGPWKLMENFLILVLHSWKEHDIVTENDTSHVTLLLLWLCFLSIWADAIPLSTL